MAIRKTSTNRLVDICMRIADETERNAHEKEQIYVIMKKIVRRRELCLDLLSVHFSWGCT